MTQILVVIGLILTCIIGVWKWLVRVKSEKRKLADEARKKLDDAKANNSKSDFLDSFGNINRV